MRKFSLGLEVIDFQKDDIFESLTQLFDTLKKSTFEDAKTIKQIRDLTFRRFGVNVIIKITHKTDFGTSVELPTFHLNNGLYNQRARDILRTSKDSDEDYKRLLKLKDFKKQNSVNLKTAKVSGIFSELEYVIYLDTDQLRLLNTQECCAVFLHEVGHLFTFFEHMVRLTTTNLVLLNVSSLAQKNITYENKIMCFELADELLEVDPSKINPNLVNSEKAVTTIYLSKISYQTKSTTGSDWYDNVSSEQAADQFVSRLGGGRHLISALDIMGKYYGSFTQKKHNYILNFGMSIFMTIVPLISLFIGGAIIGSLFSVIYIAYCFWLFDYVFFAHSFKVLTYDDEKVRFNRMRNDLVTTLKYSNDDEYKKVIIKEIEFCDKVIENYYGQMDVSKIIDFILRRKDKGIYYLQRDLEDIAFNDLFIKAEKLRLSI